MSERALAFLEEWTSENIHAGEAPAGDTTRAKELADRFLAAAAAEGIPKAEIDDAIDDLPSFMASQIEEANERDEDDDEDDDEDEEEDDEDDDEDDEDDDDEDEP
jgi:hypothetical protein